AQPAIRHTRSQSGGDGCVRGFVTSLVAAVRDRLLVRVGGKRGKAAFEVGDKILDGFQADVEAHRWAARLPAGRGARRRAVEWRRQALIAAPGGADAE